MSHDDKNRRPEDQSPDESTRPEGDESRQQDAGQGRDAARTPEHPESSEPSETPATGAEAPEPRDEDQAGVHASSQELGQDSGQDPSRDPDQEADKGAGQQSDQEQNQDAPVEHEDTPQEQAAAGDASSDAGEESAASGQGQPPAPPGDAPPPADDDPSLHDDGKGDEDDEEDEEDEEPEQMTFLDHLSELRIRLTRIAIAVGVGFLACYGFSKQLFEFLMRPLVKVFPPDSKLIFTALPEAFFTYIKVAMVAGVLLTSPYIFYQIWRFIAPGLYEEERKYLVPIALFSGLFFAAGATFGYSVVFPFAFEFFMDFATETIRPMPSLKEYLGFSLKLLFAFGLVFELPLFIFFLSRLGIVNATMLRKFRKYAFLCAFIISAVLTPPDVVSQTLMAGPLIILYEASIFISQFFGKKPKSAEPEEDEEESSVAEQEGADEAEDKA